MKLILAIPMELSTTLLDDLLYRLIEALGVATQIDPSRKAIKGYYAELTGCVTTEELEHAKDKVARAIELFCLVHGLDWKPIEGKLPTCSYPVPLEDSASSARRGEALRRWELAGFPTPGEVPRPPRRRRRIDQRRLY